MANNKNYISLNRLSNFLDNLKNTFASLTHKHTISDISDYKVDSALSSTSINPVQNKVLDAEFEAVSNAMGALETAIDGKADSSHNHDSAYASKTHNHDGVYATATHNHDTKYDAKGSAAAVQENLDAISDTLDAHTSNGDIHVTTANKTNWNAAYTHSQSAHARTDATKVADSTTNGNILINGTETNVYSHPNSGVTAGTYKSVTVNAQGHITAGTNPTTLAGYGITDAETKGAASSALASAKEYTDTVASGKANTSHNHDSAYDAKGSADTALASAKEYTNTKTSGLASTTVVDNKISTHNTSTSAHNDIRALITDLSTKLNNFLDVDDTTTDQLSEVITLINNNKGTLESLTTSKVNVSDIVDNLTTSNASKVLSAKQGVAIKTLIDDLQAAVDEKANSTHTHSISNVTNLQSLLDAKVPTTRTINGKALSANITLSASDVSAYTKTEIDNMEFITVADIDAICGTST